MEALIEVAGLAWLANLVAWSGDPFQWIKDRLRLACDTEFDERPGAVRRFLIKLLNCEKCFGFWLGFAFAVTAGGGVWDVLIWSAVVSIAAYALGFARTLPVPINS